MKDRKENDSQEIHKRPTYLVVGLVVAIIALLLSAVPIVNNFAFVLALASLLLGVVGMIKIKNNKAAGKSMAIVVVVLSLLAGIVVLASQQWYSSELDKAVEEVSDTADKATGEKTDDILGKDVDVTLGDFSATQDEYGLDTTYLLVKATNKLNEKKSYSVSVEAVDSSGNRIQDDTVYFNDLNPAQSQEEKAFQYVESGKLDALKLAKFKILTVSEY